jgi:hypothetical protein
MPLLIPDNPIAAEAIRQAERHAADGQWALAAECLYALAEAIEEGNETIPANPATMAAMGRLNRRLHQYIMQSANA